MCSPEPCRPEVGPRCRWGHARPPSPPPPPEALGETLPCLLHLLVAPGVHWLVATSLQPLPLSSRCFLLHASGSFLALMKTLVIEFRAQPNSERSHPEILTLLTSAKTPIPNKATFCGSSWECLLWQEHHPTTTGLLPSLRVSPFSLGRSWDQPDLQILRDPRKLSDLSTFVHFHSVPWLWTPGSS